MVQSWIPAVKTTVRERDAAIVRRGMFGIVRRTILPQPNTAAMPSAEASPNRMRTNSLPPVSQSIATFPNRYQAPVVAKATDTAAATNRS